MINILIHLIYNFISDYRCQIVIISALITLVLIFLFIKDFLKLYRLSAKEDNKEKLDEDYINKKGKIINKIVILLILICIFGGVSMILGY